MDFPAERFERAGATPEQLAEQKAAFDALPEGAQASLCERIAGMADADLAELYGLGEGALREAEPEVGPEPAVLLGVVAPPGEGDDAGEAVDEGKPPVVSGPAAPSTPEPPAAA
jgi:hypothetical protein